MKRAQTMQEQAQAALAEQRRKNLNAVSDASYEPWPPVEAMRQFGPDRPDVCFRVYCSIAMPILTPVVNVPGSRIIATPALWQNTNPLPGVFGTIEAPIAIIWLDEVGVINPIMPAIFEGLTPGGFYVGANHPTIIKAQFERFYVQTHPAIALDCDVLIQVKRRK